MDNNSINDKINSLISFIWSVADDCLRDVYVRGKYRDVILPMTVIKRLDSVLSPKKKQALEFMESDVIKDLDDKHSHINRRIGEVFCNISKFNLLDLTSSTNRQALKENFINYLDGFSPNIQDILNKFKFRNQIDTMDEAGILGSVIEKFANSKINLNPPVYDENGNLIKDGLDNHSMGTLFEELIRRFNEENNEEAGEHFTPRDIVELMSDLAFLPIENEIKDSLYTIYDGAAGTFGMCTVAEEKLLKIAQKNNKKVTVSLHGQEINPETYAIAKSDILIQGKGKDSENIVYGSTLSMDGHSGKTFNFMLSNPPYGKTWKNDEDRLGGKGEILDPRFVINFAGNPEFKMLPKISDGQLLFLLNNISKMKPSGSRIVEVHNGSSIFTGDAGSGESNARRYMIESDLVEAIIAIPENIFYNTGIGTFVWVLSNKKEEKRKGKIQLIDATGFGTPLRKNLGKKNCELNAVNREAILKLYFDFEDNEQSKIFNNADFGYWKILVQRPLRKKVILNNDTMKKIKQLYDSLGLLNENIELNAKEVERAGLKNSSTSLKELKKRESIKALFDVLKKFESETPYMDFVKFEKEFNSELKKHEIKGVAFKVCEKIGLDVFFVFKDEKAEIVKDSKGNIVFDSELNDTEIIPFNYEGGIDEYFKNEVLPFVPDVYINENETKIGYEISFTKHFYKPKKSRSVEEIVKDLRKLEKESEGLLESILEGLN